MRFEFVLQRQAERARAGPGRRHAGPLDPVHEGAGDGLIVFNDQHARAVLPRRRRTLRLVHPGLSFTLGLGWVASRK